MGMDASEGSEIGPPAFAGEGIQQPGIAACNPGSLEV